MYMYEIKEHPAIPSLFQKYFVYKYIFFFIFLFILLYNDRKRQQQSLSNLQPPLKKAVLLKYLNKISPPPRKENYSKLNDKNISPNWETYL